MRQKRLQIWWHFCGIRWQAEPRRCACLNENMPHCGNALLLAKARPAANHGYGNKCASLGAAQCTPHNVIAATQGSSSSRNFWRNREGTCEAPPPPGSTLRRRQSTVCAAQHNSRNTTHTPYTQPKATHNTVTRAQPSATHCCHACTRATQHGRLHSVKNC